MQFLERIWFKFNPLLRLLTPRINILNETYCSDAEDDGDRWWYDITPLLFAESNVVSRTGGCVSLLSNTLEIFQRHYTLANADIGTSPPAE